MRLVERKSVQDIGQQQFLMLLLVIEPDLDDRDRADRRSSVDVDQLRHRGIDMGAVGRDLRSVRPRDQAALRPRLPRPGATRNRN